jgi:transcriptional regulator of arginine metabolism
MMKAKRHARILELIVKEEIETQTELAQRLKDEGIDVTQATVSRDIRELQLTKTSGYIKKGAMVYGINQDKKNKLTDNAVQERLLRIVKDSVLSIDSAGNLVVIKTHEAMAGGVAEAVDADISLDVLGTIAGDNTVFCAVRSEEKANELVKTLSQKW